MFLVSLGDILTLTKTLRLSLQAHRDRTLLNKWLSVCVVLNPFSAHARAQKIMEDNENNNGNEAEEAEVTEGADDTQDESQNDGGAGDGDGTGDEGDGEGGDKKPEAPVVDANEEPPARKRNADFIIQRQQAKAKKDGENKDGDKGDEEDDSDVDDVDAEVIGKEVQKHLKPFIEKQQREEDNQEIDTFLAENADFKPYAEKVRNWAKHPSRAGVPIKALFYEVAGDDLLKIGADRQKKATDEAKKTNAGGGSNRGSEGSGTKPVWEQSQTEFEQSQNAVRTKER